MLVFNCLEIRLYAYSEGRLSYERFDLAKLTDPAQYQRFMLMLAAESLLSGRTLELLEESRREDRDITARLYRDYRKLRNRLAHHEPILYSNLPKHHANIMRLTQWLAPIAADWCEAHSAFAAVFDPDMAKEMLKPSQRAG